MYVKANLFVFFFLFVFPQDSKGEPTIINLTPKIVPILAQVMGPPADQLKEEVREQLTQLIRFLHEKQPALIRAHESLQAVL